MKGPAQKTLSLRENRGKKRGAKEEKRKQITFKELIIKMAYTSQKH